MVVNEAKLVKEREKTNLFQFFSCLSEKTTNEISSNDVARFQRSILKIFKPQIRHSVNFVVILDVLRSNLEALENKF